MTRRLTPFALTSALTLIPLPALAYIGPGAGLSAIGSILAFLGVIALMILGFVWYPLKRLFRRIRGRAPVYESESEG